MPGTFADKAAAAAVGTGSSTIPDRVTSYQSKIEEKDTVAVDFLSVAVNLKVTWPPAARVLSKQVVTPGVVDAVTLGVSPHLAKVNSSFCEARNVRTGGAMPKGVLNGNVKLSPPKNGSAMPE